MTSEDQTSLALSLHVNLVKTPSKYLGLDFKLRGKKVADFHFLVDKLTSKLQGWKEKLLSQAGKSTLISSVLQSLPLYTFSCFKVPEAICNKLDSTIRDFWWGYDHGVKKMHLLHWDKICRN